MTQRIQDDGHGRKYFAMIEHIAGDDLDVYEYRLYGHYKKVTGINGGECDESEKQTYTACGMSKYRFQKARQGLIDKGYVRIVQEGKPNTKGEKGSATIIACNDMWGANIIRYDKMFKGTELPPSSDKGVNLTGKGSKSTPPRGQNSPLKGSKSTPLKEEESNKPKESRTASEIDFSKRLARLAFRQILFQVLVDTGKQRNKDIASVIEIHLSTGAIDPNAYANKTKRQVAAAILDAGCTVQDVQEYVWSLKGNPDDPKRYPGDDWWHSRSVSLQHIASNVLAWKVGCEQSRRVEQLAQQVDDIAEDAGHPTDPRMLEVVRNMMAQMGASS